MIFLLILTVLLNRQYGCFRSQYRIVDRECDDEEMRICRHYLQYIGNLNYSNAQIRQQIVIETIQNTDHQLNIRIFDQQQLNHQVPNHKPFYNPGFKDVSQPLSYHKQYKIKYTKNPFSFRVVNKFYQDQLIFDSTADDLIFSDKYVSVSSIIASRDGVYGFSDSRSRFLLEYGENYTAWNDDTFTNDDNMNMDRSSSSHTALLFKNNQKLEHYIIIFRTSSPMTVQLYASQFNQITYHMMGGIIDMKILIHEDLNKLFRMYRDQMGGHAMPPFWSLGYIHQDGYSRNVQDFQAQVDMYRKLEFPIDGLFLDHHILNYKYKTFSVKQNFNNTSWKQFLESNRLKTAFNIFPFIHADPFLSRRNKKLYRALIDGYRQNVFLKDIYRNKSLDMIVNFKDQPMHIVDFTHPNASKYWHQQLKRLRKQVHFDGLVLDENEITIKGFGNYNISKQIHQKKIQMGQYFTKHQKCRTIRKYYPYMPYEKCLNENSIDILQEYYDGTQELQMHNVYNLYQQQNTYDSFKKMGMELPFILSKAMSFNSHKYAFYWTGVNYGGYNNMMFSIDQIARQAFHGIQMSGANICGMAKQGTTDLCARWFQLATIYPFARSYHYHYDAKHPHDMGQMVSTSASKNMKMRYSLIRYLYRLMLTDRRKGVIWKHLVDYFHTDGGIRKKTLDQPVTLQIMVGENLMAAPVTTQLSTNRMVYFPSDSGFYDFHSGKDIIKNDHTIFNNHEDTERFQQEGGKQSEYDIIYPISKQDQIHAKDVRVYNHTCRTTDYLPLFLQYGGIIQVQNTHKVKSTRDLGSTISLKVGLNNKGGIIFAIDYQILIFHYQIEAKGELILLGDLYNETNVVKYCVKKDCLAKVRLKMTKQQSYHMIIEIKDYELYKILVQSNNIVKINKLHLYHPVEQLDMNYYICQAILIIDKKYKHKYRKTVINCQKNIFYRRLDVHESQELKFSHSQQLEQIMQQLDKQ